LTLQSAMRRVMCCEQDTHHMFCFTILSVSETHRITVFPPVPRLYTQHEAGSKYHLRYDRLIHLHNVGPSSFEERSMVSHRIDLS
jgi:hypothetical protein